MAVTINAKGTSVDTFTVGKGGMSLDKTGVITPPIGSNLRIDLADEQSLVIDAGTEGPALITTTNNQDLHLNPAVGGGQYLVLNDSRWPAADGTANQVLTTNGAGVLSYTTLNRIGSPAPATNATTGFAYIPVTDGTPAGVPNSISGFVPIVADSSGSKIWVYIGAEWKSINLS